MSTDLGDAELVVAYDDSIARRTAYVPANLPETAMLGAAPGLTIERLEEVVG